MVALSVSIPNSFDILPVPLHLGDLILQCPFTHSLEFTGVGMSLAESDIDELCEALRISRESGRALTFRRLALGSRVISLPDHLKMRLEECGVTLQFCFERDDWEEW